MGEPTRFDLTADADDPDGPVLAGYRWDPDGTPRAIAQLVHGVGEYATRYGPLADELTRHGYVVYAHDHPSHGASAGSPADFGVLGEDGWRHLVDAIGRTGRVGRAEHPGLPLTVIAHSLGSFATQQWLLDRSGDVDAVVLSGTAAIDLLEPMMDLDAPMDLSGFNAPFAPARTDFDWLSRDEHEVDRYVADPWCGFGLDAAGTRAAFAGSHAVADPARLSAMRPDLPLYVVVGELDPVNGQLALVHALVERYREAGLADVTLRTYPGARHEIFNETNRDEVFADLVEWMATERRGNV